jgi:cytochrome c oxidase subunit 4
MEEQHSHEPVSYGTYTIIWLSLVVLTVFTVSISGINLEALTVTVALLVATVKAWLVFSVFMHLKYDKKYLTLMLGVSFVTLLFMFITFFDIANR